jgi:hypothetical protein
MRTVFVCEVGMRVFYTGAYRKGFIPRKLLIHLKHSSSSVLSALPTQRNQYEITAFLYLVPNSWEGAYFECSKCKSVRSLCLTICVVTGGKELLHLPSAIADMALLRNKEFVREGISNEFRKNFVIHIHKQNKSRGLSLRANYTDRATAACRRSWCQVASVADPYSRILGFLDRNRYYLFQLAPQLYSLGWVDPVPDRGDPLR